MKKSTMTAAKLRTTLIVIIVLLIIGTGAGFYFASKWLTTFAVDVSHANADSTATGENIQNLKSTQDELASEQAVQAKAAAISVPTLTYQNQSIVDLNTYASLTGVEIDNYSFGTGTAAPVVATATPAVANTAAAATAATAQSSTVTVTVKSPVSYVSFLKFITLVEHNLPKMQISSVNLGGASSASGSSGLVTTDQLTISVYTK